MQSMKGPQGSALGHGWSRRQHRRATCPVGQPSPLPRTPASRPHRNQFDQQPRQNRTTVYSVDPDNQQSFSFELLGPSWSNRARLTEDMLSSIMELPGTRGMYDLRTRADALSAWKLALQRGTLPKMDEVEWPQEPFRTKFADALRNMEMPRFTRRYPAILDTLIKQMLNLAQDFEEKLMAAEKQQQQQQQQQQQSSQSRGQGQQEQDQQGGEQQQASAAGGGGADEQGEMPQELEISEEELQQMMQEAMEAQGKPKQSQNQQQGRQLQIKLENMEGDAGKESQESQNAMAAQMEKIAEDIVKKFEQQMGEVMENLEAGEMAFDDLNALLEGSEGFDLSRGTWRRSGWRELDALRQVLEKVPELRELVRQLGRGGGRGPLRRAPEELEARGYPPGVIRSPLQPEEVRGLARSGDLSRMLPSEMALLAHGWPRKAQSSGAAAAAAAAQRAASAAAATTNGNGSRPTDRGSWRTAIANEMQQERQQQQQQGSGPQGQGQGQDEHHGVHVPVDASVSSGEYDLEEYYLPGAHAARRLHRVRRAERMLLSYDRTGWLDNEPARVTSRMEIRPAAELGPIILCLDTSGSMRGARETVAKALALECLRGAHRQRRACYLYAFSGPNEVQELELKADIEGLDALLEFLSCSFMGGTDVDAPLKLSLERLAQAEWSQADILMVTDGEIPNPDDKIVQAITTAHADMGLEVHGLLVASTVSEAMRKLCTDVHVFRSWTAVPGGNDYMYT